ncbi:Wzz/FepE/Etk N-terminal domain-containing protein [Azohydromonas lata]|uniref:Wzz/FepE/Etk N-terminal domain-containing protein n=1 Tax=Azohydromonas lata TaxID=45677 RepID=UPI000831FFCB|nr:Wzz/FepE/Etk N-terminal domain-containing protein [Azohydromonas lata]
MRADAAPFNADDKDEGVGLLDLAIPLAANRKLLVLGPLLAGVVALGVTFIIPPTYTAKTTFLPPQQQQSAAAAALSSLSVLSGLTGGTSMKSAADQYVSLMRSVTVQDHIVNRFKLMDVYDAKYKFEARQTLDRNVQISLGKKDGLISVEVDDTDPQRAAEMANAHVDELRQLTSGLALSEAQQRRAFFEVQLNQTRDRLTQAQQVLQASGFDAGALKTEPRAAAESYAALRAEATAAEVRLQVLSRSLANDAPEVQQIQARLGALRSQLARAEQNSDRSGGPDYVNKFREFKYQETLFDLFARQYEMARTDEASEGALIQVLDTAMPPEWKSKPKRALTAVVTMLVTLLLLAGGILVRHLWQRSAADPQNAEKLAQLRTALRRS